MRIVHGIFYLAALLLTEGCTSMYDDLSDCILENTTLIFTYKDVNGNDIFPRDIHSVDAYIFDEAKKFVMHHRSESNELDMFAGWKLNLTPGDYYVVCWGNVGGNTRIDDFVKGVTTFDECTIQIPPSITSSGNPIYYAPYKKHPESRSGVLDTRAIDPSMQEYGFHVVAQTENIKEMIFVSAYRTINVYIIGYPGSATEPAMVTGTQLYAEYDFYYVTKDVTRNFTQPALPVTLPEGALLATFYVGFSEIKDNMNFILKKGEDGATLETVNLKNFLEEFPEEYNDTINIVIKFTELGVTITVPGWNNVPVTPGT